MGKNIKYSHRIRFGAFVNTIKQKFRKATYNLNSFFSSSLLPYTSNVINTLKYIYYYKLYIKIYNYIRCNNNNKRQKTLPARLRYERFYDMSASSFCEAFCETYCYDYISSSRVSQSVCFVS